MKSVMKMESEMADAGSLMRMATFTKVPALLTALPMSLGEGMKPTYSPGIPLICFIYFPERGHSRMNTVRRRRKRRVPQNEKSS